MRLLIALVVWVGCIGGAWEIQQAVASNYPSSSSSSGSSASGGGASTGSGGGASSFDPSSVKATDSDSLFRTANFTKALATVRKQYGADAQLTNVALYPGYFDPTIVRGGQEVNDDVEADGTVNVSTGGSAQGDQTFPLTQLPADGPQTLAERIAKYGGTPESELNYMVIDVDPTSGKIEWLVYPLQGSKVEYFQAASPTTLIHGFVNGG
ncbi:MAG: hypothetical protein ACLP01_03285 [Solirubrobacteraceae bacterium]